MPAPGNRRKIGRQVKEKEGRKKERKCIENRDAPRARGLMIEEGSASRRANKLANS